MDWEALGGLGRRCPGRDRLAPTKTWCGFLVAFLRSEISRFTFEGLEAFGVFSKGGARVGTARNFFVYIFLLFSGFVDAVE